MRHTLICFCCIALVLVAGPALGEEPAPPSAQRGVDALKSDAVKSDAVKSDEKKSEEKEVEKSEKKAKDEKGAKSGKTAKKSDDSDKLLSGMSIVGNDEAPKSLVIVPWKSSELGQTLDISKDLDDGRGPVDKDVFMRELAYYGIRSEPEKAGDSGSK